MTLTWYGGTCLKVQSGETVIAVDPDGAPGAHPRFRADIVLHTNGVPRQSSEGPAAVFEVSGPGEYELSNIIIQGFPVRDEGDLLHTLYLVEVEGMRLVAPGKLRVPDGIKGDIVDELGSVDLLAVPVGPGGLSAADATTVIRELEPRVAIPLSMDGSSERDVRGLVEMVAKRVGAAEIEEMPKLAIRKNALDPEANIRIVCLKPCGA